MIHEVQERIRRLKKEKGVTILAHSYQAEEILEIADYIGDSFQLSVQAQKDSAATVLMAGVHFMAEVVKILSPEKRVVLAHPNAGCPMAEQVEPELVEAFRRDNPDYTVVCYINTTAALKTVCDVCVTSSTAVKIVQALPGKDILFLPDRNLGDYVAKQVPEKNVKLWQGGCPIHAAVTEADALAGKAQHPDALLLVHPECIPKVVALADFIGSTSAIMDYAKASPAKEFLIGTENSIAEHLSYLCPDKRFYALSKKMVCPNMKLTTLVDVLHALEGDGGLDIELDADTMAKSRRCIDEMIRLGK